MALRSEAGTTRGFEGVLLITSVCPDALSLITRRLRLLELPPTEGSAWRERVMLLLEIVAIDLCSVALIGLSFPPS